MKIWNVSWALLLILGSCTLNPGQEETGKVSDRNGGNLQGIAPLATTFAGYPRHVRLAIARPYSYGHSDRSLGVTHIYAHATRSTVTMFYSLNDGTNWSSKEMTEIGTYPTSGHNYLYAQIPATRAKFYFRYNGGFTGPISYGYDWDYLNGGWNVGYRTQLDANSGGYQAGTVGYGIALKSAKVVSRTLSGGSYYYRVKGEIYVHNRHYNKSVVAQMTTDHPTPLLTTANASYSYNYAVNGAPNVEVWSFDKLVQSPGITSNVKIALVYDDLDDGTQWDDLNFYQGDFSDTKRWYWMSSATNTTIQ